MTRTTTLRTGGLMALALALAAWAAEAQPTYPASAVEFDDGQDLQTKQDTGALGAPPDGTVGQLQTNDGAGGFSAVAEGTAGQVLTSQGAAQAPAMSNLSVDSDDAGINSGTWPAGPQNYDPTAAPCNLAPGDVLTNHLCAIDQNLSGGARVMAEIKINILDTAFTVNNCFRTDQTPAVDDISCNNVHTAAFPLPTGSSLAGVGCTVDHNSGLDVGESFNVEIGQVLRTGVGVLNVAGATLNVTNDASGDRFSTHEVLLDPPVAFDADTGHLGFRTGTITAGDGFTAKGVCWAIYGI